MNKVVSSLPKVIAILPAAGIGSRMQTDCPKQYLTIMGKTILEHTINALLCHARIQQIIVAINPQDDRFQALPIARDPRVIAVCGGEQRAESVMSALLHAEQTAWVLVHDADRPCLHYDNLDRLLSIIAHSTIGGILAAPVRDTMKRGQAGVTTIAHTVERQELWHALTPQLFPFQLLKSCLSRALNEGAMLTDEASALKYCGYYPLLIKGRSDNIKVTHPEDLTLAEFFLTHLYPQE